MSVKTCQIFIDDQPFEFQVEGDFFWGQDEVLFDEKDAVLKWVSWKEKGYKVVHAFSDDAFQCLQNSVKNNIVQALKESNISFDPSTFSLSKYHQVVTNDQDHFKVIDKTRNLEVKDFDFDINKLVTFFGKELGVELTSWVEELQKSHIQIRISRPNSLDINPPHRDGYLSYWENIVNVWIPISGCTHETSLPVVEGSHLIPESDILRTESKGAKINGNRYHVPCLLESKEGAFNMIRPNPAEGEALLFSPFLIHGSAINQSKDITRIALELRFPRVG